MSRENSGNGNGKAVRQLPDGSAAARAEFRRRVQQDRALVDRCVSGDAEAWGELYRRYNHRLTTMVKGLLDPTQWDPNLVEEITARVWYSLLAEGGQLLDRFDPERECRLSTFLGAIAKSEAGSFFRSERRRRRRERLASRPESTGGHGLPNWAPSELREFFGGLSPQEKAYLLNSLLSRPNGGASPFLSAENRWQLRCRIRRKLRRFLGLEA